MKRFAMQILPLLAFASLGSCSSPPAEAPVFADQETPPQFQVEKQQRQFIVPVGRDTAEPSPIYRSGFDRFLAETAAGNPQSLHVTLRGGSPQTVAALQHAAIADGVDPTKIEIEPTSSSLPASTIDGATQVTVIATSYRAKLPACPRLSGVSGSDNQNLPWSNFGCSVNSALEMMVVDPRDLIKGETGGETDSAISSAAIDRLMQGKVKKFDTQSFTPLGTPGGGGTQ